MEPAGSEYADPQARWRTLAAPARLAALSERGGTTRVTASSGASRRLPRGICESVSKLHRRYPTRHARRAADERLSDGGRGDARSALYRGGRPKLRHAVSVGGTLSP